MAERKEKTKLLEIVDLVKENYNKAAKIKPPSRKEEYVEEYLVG